MRLTFFSQAEIVPLLLEQQAADRDGVQLARRRLVVFVYNGHTHYDATFPLPQGDVLMQDV